ncbi:MAG: polysaccharide ABC transporter ATP-binding protein [Candidatus Reddybacter sp.]
MPPVIEVEHLTKEYSLGTVTSIKDTVRHILARLSGRKTWHRESFKALDDVSFSIDKGEVVGIIGHNGAGKSTLLKHLANITTPTSGEISVRGSVAPLIEVGAGVNPELTGRENIYLNGAILGIPKKVTHQKIDEIINFAELEQFIDTPVKRYSSGMKVKLGFSIATSMEADILIVDEVLAVGDLAFQRKCFSRIEKMLHQSNKTVLIVSHNVRQITRLCTRTILLDHGKIIADGASQEVCNTYYEQMNNRVLAGVNKEVQSSHAHIRSSGSLILESIEILTANGLTDEIKSGGFLKIKINFTLDRTLKKPEIIIGTHTTDFVYLTSSTTSTMRDKPDLAKGGHEIEFSIPSFPLVPGIYCVRFIVRDELGVSVYMGETLKTFTVTPSSNELSEEDSKLRLINTDALWAVNGAPYQ